MRGQPVKHHWENDVKEGMRVRLSNRGRAVEATRSVTFAGLDGDDSGANGSEAATAGDDETGMEEADMAADEDAEDARALERARVLPDRR